ncbi:FAD-dependent oxidoreductase [Streptomyces sp. NPDC004610]|uniref:oxidoreductase n=1 Tax=unclassified Streptomyces TaxID=2593676 RepID=UPI0033BE04BB
MDPRHAILFEPVRIGPKTLANRFYQVPHASGFATVRPRTHAAFRAVKAEGGWGGVCTEYSPVSPDADETPVVGAECWHPRDMRLLGSVAEAIHAHGALAGIELFHGGAASVNGSSRLPRVAPTQDHTPTVHASRPKAMTLADIHRIQDDFERAARRARDVGFDIVYVYGAHDYLMTQMLSRTLNRRTDGYGGGSLRDRARFQLETLERVRAAIGDDCAVAVRTPVGPGRDLPGLDEEELLEFIRLADPYVDLFDVNVGGWPEDSGTSRYYGEGSQLPWTRRVREATAKPVVGVGRFSNPDLMADLVRSGDLDLIGAARPAIADPFLPAKIREGRSDDIRECTGSNVCILREETFHHVGCVQNPTAGEEYRRGWHPELFTRTTQPERPVLVVGGGPAGMECAVVLGRRGFEAVHLVEAAGELGGKLRWTRRLPTLGDWGRIVDHRLVQLAKLPAVTTVLNRTLDADAVLDYGAELVVVTTGSVWAADGFQPGTGRPLQGAELALTPEQIMAGSRPAPGRVVVYDGEGYYTAPGLAELLRDEGYEVHLVTPLEQVSPVSDLALEGPMLRQHLHDKGVVFHTAVVLHAFDGTAVTGRTGYGDPWTLPADGLVLATVQRSDDALYRELLRREDEWERSGVRAVYAAGDVLAPRMPSEAVFDAHRLAREIDGPDPMTPLPVLIERPGVED